MYRRMARGCLRGLVCLLAFIVVGCSSSGSFEATEDIKISVTTNPNPPQTGDGQLLIYLARSDGQAISNVKVSVSVTASGMKTGSQDSVAVNQGNGWYIYPMSFHMQTQYAVRLWIYRAGKLIAVQDSAITM